MLKQKRIFEESSDQHAILITQEILDMLQIGDEVYSHYVEAEYGSDHGNDAHFTFQIHRMVEETEEEKQRRVAKDERDREHARQRRHKSYLKLKKEFEK